MRMQCNVMHRIGSQPCSCGVWAWSTAGTWLRMYCNVKHCIAVHCTICSIATEGAKKALEILKHLKLEIIKNVPAVLGHGAEQEQD